MAIHIYQNVFRLDITIDNVAVMQVLKAKQDLTHEKLRLLLAKPPVLQQVKEDLTASADIHDKEQLMRALKGPMELDQKWVIELDKHLLFANDLPNSVLVI